MLTLVLEGGFPIWFVLVFGGFALFCGIRFALAPSRQRLRLTGALGLTTWFATLTAVCADFAAVGHHGPEFLSHHPELPLHAVVLQGVAEALSPAIVGLSVLTVCALLVALGCHRDPVDA